MCRTRSPAAKAECCGGAGTTSIEVGAKATVAEGSALFVEEQTLENAGTLTVGLKSALQGSKKMALQNAGTLVVNGATREEGHGLIAVEGEASLTNTGVVQKTEGSEAAPIEFAFDNEGKVSVTSGQLEFTGGGTSSKASAGSWSASGKGTKIVFAGGSYSLGEKVLVAGAVEVNDGTVAAGSIEGAEASVTLSGMFIFVRGATLELTGKAPSTLESLTFTHKTTNDEGGTLQTSGQVNITHSFTGGGLGEFKGGGTIAIEVGATGTISPMSSAGFTVREGTIKNAGTFTVGEESGLEGSKHAEFLNIGTFTLNGEPEAELHGLISAEREAKLVNSGTLKKTEGTGETPIEWEFENLGSVIEEVGKYKIFDEVRVPNEQDWGSENPSAPGQAPPSPACGDPVNCATGNYYESQTDFAIGGRGVGLDLTRTYNSQAGAASITGPFGYCWSAPYGDHVTLEKSTATLHQANGSTVVFIEGAGEAFTPPAWSQDSLHGSAKIGYGLVLANQVKYQFEGSTGRLESITDRNGNQTKLAYNKAGRLETVTDPSGRALTFAYNGEGLIESAKDPMGNTVKYTYESGNLASVTLPGETKPRWRYEYDGSHQMTAMTDGRGGKTTNEYDGSHRLVSQTDPAEHKLKFEYSPFHTRITSKSTGAVTDEYFTSDNELSSITRGFGTASATTESFTYDAANDLASVTDGNGHSTRYTYENGNRTSMTDPDSDETKWAYDGTHDVVSVTDPNGETTEIVRNAHGDAEKVSRPAPAGAAQTTTYHYSADGELTSVVDPRKDTWEYEYDNEGDLTSERDPEGDKRTFAYNGDSQEISTVSPRGNMKGSAEPIPFTVKIERDSLGRAKAVIDPLGHTTKYKYDGNGNLEAVTDPDGHTTAYGYNGDNELKIVKEPNGDTVETGYDGAGQVVSQTDGNKHTTTYARNALGEIVEEKDPRGRVTKKEYDAAGNLIGITDPAKRTTTFSYDPANRLKEITYSDGKTPGVKYKYDADGNRVGMTDGTGTAAYAYNTLDQLVQSTDGHGDTTSYEYDLNGNQTKLTYPSGGMVTRAFDGANRLKSVTDPNGNTTSFTYNADSEPATTTFPKSTGEQDAYAYNDADQQTKATMSASGLKVLASVAYGRENDGQVKTTTTTGLPGVETTVYTYDADNRVVKAGSTGYTYDAANNPTKIGEGIFSYSQADELESGEGKFHYNEVGQRIETHPGGIPITTYGYDQAGNLTSIARAAEGKTTGIEDAYAYDGNGLRASQTISGSKTFMTWNLAEAGPAQLLSDGANSYVYGPEGVPVEQISSSQGKALFLHHDQQGSTRLVTGLTGAVEGKCSYTAYGTPTCEGSATAPLGYDGQYTSSETGLIYLRAREYDPATAQFMSVDPAVEATRTPYNYAADDPLNESDPLGLSVCGSIPLVSEACEFLNESGISNTAAGALSFLTFGVSTEVGGELFGFSASCANFGETGTFLGAAIGFFDGEDEAELGAEITGFTSHGLAQAIGREGVGVSDQAMLDAVRDPERIVEQANGTTRYVGKDATVVLNSEKHVVTAWANSSAGWRTQP
jgi:RHS repeat-associated protein